MKKTTLFVLTISMIVSCFSPNYIITKSHSEVCKEMCLGKQKHEIISIFGPHDRKTEDGLGGEVLVYTQESIISADYSNTRYTVFANVLSSYTTTRSVFKKDDKEMAFYLDTLNYCYKLTTEVYDLRDRLIDLGDDDFVEFQERQSDDPNSLYFTFKERLEDYHGEEL